MYRYLRWLLPTLLLVALFVDLALWGGIHDTPAVGPETLRSAQKEGPLALTYMHGGDWLFGALGLSEWSQAFAQRRVGTAYADVQAVPEAAMDILIGSMSLPVRSCHNGAPVLLLAWLLAWWLRPKQIQTIRRK